MTRITMTDFFKQFANFISPDPAPQAVPAPGVAQNLMERAGLEAGRNPANAAELRDAARAFLSVVR